jgi:leucyl-tRNA synthetase
MSYDHREIEKQAQEKWARLDLYRTDLALASKDPYYLLVEFPYPSGDLHIGHWYAFAVTDIYARLLRLRGKNVLFPIGFDAFGLPAENAAIKNGVDPKEWTYKNIERMRTQLRSMGPSFDWSKEVVTCDPSYYQWTQWLFVKLFEHNLAEHREAAVKWCPKDQTVLANEQVIDGSCERCGTPVEEKRLTQWFLKITDYAERLLTGLDPLPWREEIKEAQRAWIGKSEGAELDFLLDFKKDPKLNDNRGPDGERAMITVFTTRPDTVFGATYLVLAPEHPWVTLALDEDHDVLTNKEEVRAYVEATKRKTERERSENKEKTGVVIGGVMAINPATKEEIPIYVADYVLGSYGTGAVMAVPAHDERDGAFAEKYDLPLRYVIAEKMVDSGNPPIEGKATVMRHTVLAVVHDPKTDTYLALRWKQQPWTTFVTGGINEDEDVIQAGLREVREEAGYTNLKYVRTLGGPIQAQFFAAHKDENRIAINTSVLFELMGGEQDDVSEGEQSKYEVQWLTLEEIISEKMRHAEIAVIAARVRGQGDIYTGDGVLINSGEFTGQDSERAKWDIVASIGGRRATQYRIRDWLISRQRYWGCPIPIVYDPEGKPHAIPAEHLPWMLPTDADFRPTGKAPLASSDELRERVTKIFGEGWTPEYDTLDTFADSSWYFLRYLDSEDAHDFSDAGLMKRWMPVNRYSGGSEHTTMHLLYARFFMKALYDLALVPVDEPFLERYNRGLIMGPDGQKMSKSKGNVVNPDEFVQKYGADAVRLYLAFIGPYNEPGSYPWNLEGVASMRKFLERAARLVERPLTSGEVPEKIQQAITKASTKVALDGDRFKLNTAVAALMTLMNELETLPEIPKIVASEMLIMLAPFAPHLTEHLWEKLGQEGSVHAQDWPAGTLAVSAAADVVVQVNGKRRGLISLSLDAAEEEAAALAKEIPAVAAALGGKEPLRIIYKAGKILNLVA